MRRPVIRSCRCSVSRSGCRSARCFMLALVAAATLPLAVPAAARAQVASGGGGSPGTPTAETGEDRPPVGREAVEALAFPPLEFEAPEVRREVVGGSIPVLFLEDHSLPLVDVMVRFHGGFAHFPREELAAATALASLLRTGGTAELPPDSVDHRIEYLALQTSFGGGGTSAFSSLNVLSENVEEGIDLWSEMIRAPRFDSAQVEIWRGRALEGVRRRNDSPTSVAYSEFNRLMFGDSPTGWEMSEEDLSRERLSRARLQRLHERIYCRENATIGVAGDLTWDAARALLEEAVEAWPACSEPIPEDVGADPRDGGGVFLIPRASSQSVVILAEPAGVRNTDGEAYHAATLANAILGAGGFTSRLVSRVRSDAGLAYSVSSLWTTPRNGEGIVGAMTQTRADATIEATRMILEVMREMGTDPPSEEEVRLAVDEIVNGFVFNFESPAQIVSRQVLYESEGMPEDYLERFVEGIQDVEPEAIRAVVSEHLDPENMTILIVGDTARFDRPPGELGPVTVLELDEPD